MKKLSIILLLVTQFGQVANLGQQTSKNEMNKEQRVCSVKMITMDNAKNSYVLHRFSYDSLFALPFTETENGSNGVTYYISGHEKNVNRSHSN